MKRAKNLQSPDFEWSAAFVWWFSLDFQKFDYDLDIATREHDSLHVPLLVKIQIVAP
jgi:hypothetical protein